MPEPRVPEKKKQNRPAEWQRYLSLGTQLLVLLALGVFGGVKLDQHLGLSPLFTILLPTLALVLSLIQLYRKLIR